MKLVTFAENMIILENKQLRDKTDKRRSWKKWHHRSKLTRNWFQV